jgi:transposase
MTRHQRPGRYPVEFRERAVRMVFEAERHGCSQWAAIMSMADKLGPTPATVRKWVRRFEADDGRRAGVATNERQRLRVLESENR